MPVLPQVVFVQQQVVGRGLASDVHAVLFSLPDHPEGFLGGDVADVVAAAGLGCQLQIPCNGAPLALRANAPVAVGFGVGALVDIAAPEEGIVFTVGDDELAQGPGALHGLPHETGILHPVAVVGEGDHIRRHGLQIGQLPSGLVHGDGAVGAHVDHGVPADDGQLLLQMLPAVRHRVQVGHGADGGVSAPGGGAGAAGDGFLIRKARFAQVHMHIAKTGQ